MNQAEMQLEVNWKRLSQTLNQTFWWH